MKLTVPTSFKDVTIGQLIQLSSLSAVDTIRKRVHSTAILCGIDYEVSKSLPLRVHAEIEMETMFVYREPEISQPKPGYKLGDLYYKPTLDLSTTSADQYIIAKHLIKDGNVLTHMHKLIACFLLPTGKDHSAGIYEQTCKAVYDHMNIEDAYSLQVFFCNLYQVLTADSQTSIVEGAMGEAFQTIRSKGIGAL